MRSKPFIWFFGILILTGFSAWLISRFLRRTNVPTRSGSGTSPKFNRRILPGPTYLRQELDYWLNHPEDIKALRRGRRVSQSFAKRLILVVTGVNQCRYCKFGHVRSAAHMGFTQDEIAGLLDGDLSNVDPYEIGALLFASHYAESAGRPDAVAVSRLKSEYGIDTAQDILTTIRLIMLGNLVGNTFDAFLSRLRGRPASGSALADELASLSLLMAGFVPYSVALGLRLYLAETPGANRPNVLVLQE